jgi:hypothetical protein
VPLIQVIKFAVATIPPTIVKNFVNPGLDNY